MFINLTDIHDGTFAYINPRQITAFFDLGNGSTKIYDTVAENSYEVKETPEQILALIEAEKRKALRDELAGKVAVGIMRTCDETPGTAVNRDDIAMEAYRMADAMPAVVADSMRASSARLDRSCWISHHSATSRSASHAGPGAGGQARASCCRASSKRARRMVS